jgi:hypothetical protein
MSITVSERRKLHRSKYTIALIFLVCVLPFFGSYALYLFWPPGKLVNYGDLIKPMPIVDVTVRERGGKEFRFADLRGKWVFLMVDAGACDAHCRQKLYYMRQIRLTQGKDQDRIERLWLISDGVRPPVELSVEYQGTREVLLDRTVFLERLPAPQSSIDHLYIVDPLGNLMLRFPRDVDPNRMKKDVSKLLHLSSGWRQIKQ